MGRREIIKIWKLKPPVTKEATVRGYINVATANNNLFPRGAEYIVEGKMDVWADDSTLTSTTDEGMVYRVYRDASTNVPYIIRNNEKFTIEGKEENPNITPIFKFYVNPRNIHIGKSKLITKLRTRGGFEFQHWGPDISTIAFGGTTGNITPTSFVAQIRNENPTVDNSEAYKIFRDFEQLYEEDQQQQEIGNITMLGLEYRGNIYVGHLRNFGFDEVGEKPFQLDYAVEFAVEYEATSVSKAQQEIQQNIIRNADTIDYLKKLAEGGRKSG
jgi:hypothetical protein